MRFPLVMDGMRLSLPNVKRVFLAAIAVHNFILNTGGGYFEVVDENVDGYDYDPDAPVGEDEDEVVST